MTAIPTLGFGTVGSVEELVMLGFNPPLTVPSFRQYAVPDDDRTVTVPASSRTITVPEA